MEYLQWHVADNLLYEFCVIFAQKCSSRAVSFDASEWQIHAIFAWYCARYWKKKREKKKKLFVRVAQTWHFRYANICFDFAYESRIWQLNIFVFICFPCKCNNETRSLSHFWFHSPVKCRNWKWQLDGRRNFW